MIKIIAFMNCVTMADSSTLSLNLKQIRTENSRKKT